MAWNCSAYISVRNAYLPNNSAIFWASDLKFSPKLLEKNLEGKNLEIKKKCEIHNKKQKCKKIAKNVKKILEEIISRKKI